MSAVDRWENVDFKSEAEYAGGFNGFGDTSNCMSFGDTGITVIEKSRWPALIEQYQASKSSLSYLVDYVNNQRNEGSCVGNGWMKGFEVKFRQQFGFTVPMSSISLYNRIGQSPSSGAMVVDGLRELQQRGAVPLDTEVNRGKYPVLMPATGFSRRMPDGWEESAKRFKVLEAFTVRGVAEVITCLLNGMPVVVGRDGHCIVQLEACMRNGKIAAKYVNSWGDWGDAGGNLPSGFGYDTGGALERAAQEAFAIRSVSKGYIE